MTFSPTHPFESLAIVGMAAAWAGCDSLDAFEQMIYTGRQQFASFEGKKTAVPAVHLLAQQALEDAGIASTARVAVLVAGGAPMPSDWSWAVSFMDLSSTANPLAQALLKAQSLLSGGEADAVVFAAGSSPVETGDPLNIPDGASGFGFDREVHTWRLGQGAGAVAWMLPSQAQREGRRMYALIRGMAIASERSPASSTNALPVPPSLEDVRACIRGALEQTGVQPEQIGYIESFASGSDALDGIEIAGLAQTYRQPVQDLTTALGSVQANTGYLGPAAGLAGLIRVALCLYQRIIPGAPGWIAPKLPALWRGAPFYVPSESRAWFVETGGSGRLAAFDLLGQNGAFAHLVLSETTDQTVHPNHALTSEGFYLFPLAGADQAELLAQLTSLAGSLANGQDIALLARECFESAQKQAEAPFALAIVGHDVAEVAREVELAIKALPGAFEKHTEWQTPLGSYFTAEPAGRLGGVALVYPGAFNSYPGLGKDLFRLFPELFEYMTGVTTSIARVTRERMLYPRSLSAISKEELALLESRLLADPIAMLISGTAMAILYTRILREAFKIHPQASFGYSLGENAMLFATGVWNQGDGASLRLEQSEAFRVRLAGPQTAIRDYWGLAQQPAAGDPPLWCNYLVMAPVEKVQSAMAGETHVYITHINTPRQVVIGGDPDACKRVLAALHGSSLQAPFDYALHCEVMRSQYDALAELHNWPVEAQPGLKMFSAADYAPLTIEQYEISQKIAQMLTTPLDFPRLIRTVYEDGARVFIEAGAGSNCARWIDETLKGSPHLALSMNRRGTDDYSTLVRTLARLHSHRVPMDLSVMYAPENEKVRL